jgi:hypothetical protein
LNTPFERDPAVVERTSVHAVQAQALGIIDAVLSDPDPDIEEARTSLRQHLAENPDKPARALLLHLMSTRTSTT